MSWSLNGLLMASWWFVGGLLAVCESCPGGCVSAVPSWFGAGSGCCFWSVAFGLGLACFRVLLFRLPLLDDCVHFGAHLLVLLQGASAGCYCQRVVFILGFWVLLQHTAAWWLRCALMKITFML